MRLVLILALLAPLPDFAHAVDLVSVPSPPTRERQQALVRMVRQDCGSCHGMRLTGGLGPALTPQALADRPLEALLSTTLYGRPGTPMPAWKAMLSTADALWIAQQLQAGFPAEAAR
jgi:cytochrome c55X